MPENLIFHLSPEITIGTNRFRDVPVILRYEDEPLIEMLQHADASFTTGFRIYNDSGDKIAAVEGTQIYLTDAGKASNLNLVYPAGKTICELDGNTLFEIERTEAAALRASAELYTPDGRFVKAAADAPPELYIKEGEAMKVGGIVMAHNLFVGVDVGIDIRADGNVGIGVNL